MSMVKKFTNHTHLKRKQRGAKAPLFYLEFLKLKRWPVINISKLALIMIQSKKAKNKIHGKRNKYL